MSLPFSKNKRFGLAIPILLDRAVHAIVERFLPGSPFNIRLSLDTVGPLMQLSYTSFYKTSAFFTKYFTRFLHWSALHEAVCPLAIPPYPLTSGTGSIYC